MGDSLPERNDPNTERNQGKTAYGGQRRRGSVVQVKSK
jgi:hypothetical protein